MLTASAVRVLGIEDRAAATRLLARDPVANVFISARLPQVGRSWRSGGQLWGHVRDGRLDGLCWSGANLVPVAGSPDALMAFVDRARRQGRRCSSIVGPREAVLTMWHHLEPAWGEAREVRSDQPLMALTGPPQIQADPLVRLVRPDELDLVFPAAVAMFTEEVGVSPLAFDGGSGYRSRVAELVRAERAYARIEDGEVLFKAEIGAAAGGVCQVQGVWVDPRRRGEGLSLAGMAAVARLAQERVAPTVSLYVNAWNVPARRCYERVGFEQVGTFATVLF